MSPSCRFKLQLDDFNVFPARIYVAVPTDEQLQHLRRDVCFDKRKLKTLTSFATNGGFCSQQYQKRFDIGARKMPQVYSPLSLTVKWGLWREKLSRQKLPEESMLTVVFTLGSSQSYVRHTRLHKFRLYRAFK
jgi:hypothetical protein